MTVCLNSNMAESKISRVLLTRPYDLWSNESWDLIISNDMKKGPETMAWEIEGMKDTKFFPMTNKETGKQEFRRLKNVIHKLTIRKDTWPEDQILTVQCSGKCYRIKYSSGEQEGPYGKSRFISEFGKRVGTELATHIAENLDR
jgi:hypothetical protein